MNPNHQPTTTINHLLIIPSKKRNNSNNLQTKTPNLHPLHPSPGPGPNPSPTKGTAWKINMLEPTNHPYNSTPGKSPNHQPNHYMTFGGFISFHFPMPGASTSSSDCLEPLQKLTAEAAAPDQSPRKALAVVYADLVLSHETCQNTLGTSNMAVFETGLIWKNQKELHWDFVETLPHSDLFGKNDKTQRSKVFVGNLG